MSLKTNSSGVKNKKTIAESNFCIVCEYLKGGSLRSYLRKNKTKKLSMKNVVQFALDIAKGLSYLHSNKIIHCDVKPENMLIDKHHTIKIADFGESVFMKPSQFILIGNQSGTLGYMAPENMRPSIPVDCPKWLARLMERCWNTDPTKRPEMKDVVVELEEIQKSHELQTMSGNRHGVFGFSCFGV
ncbi:serine/threonine-protein kinase 52-like [Rutidosis leptorrhynchoides]|uniref:serine/threonine-protein kinase 52-like n=1 Tax=Rutidosis leptorrhynchoides TaxID=125765 RepID=UPI003A9A6105